MPHRPNEANGHLVRGSELSVWLVGDTSLYPEMAEIPDLLGRRLDLIACRRRVGAAPLAGPPRPRRGRHRVCEVRGTVGAAGPLGDPAPPMPTLMGAGWMDRPYDEFVRALHREAPDCRLVELMPGGVWRGGD